jgi:DUF1365 family protein
MTEHVAARTVHLRDAEGLRRRFGYSVDYVLTEPEREAALPAPSALLAACAGATEAARARAELARAGPDHGGRLLLLAQPRVLGRVFDPVRFWFLHDATGALRAVLAEVTNTYGDRHAYALARTDHGPIGPGDMLRAGKRLHVSPFLPAEAEYLFRFDLRPDRVAVRIEHRAPAGRLVASLAGPRRPLTRSAAWAMVARRPLASQRVLGLIHWQALLLRWAGARFRRRPAIGGR